MDPTDPTQTSVPEFSRREVVTARIFCVAVGAIAVAGGCAAYTLATGAAATAGLVAALAGSALVIFGFTASDHACVKVAGSVLSLF